MTAGEMLRISPEEDRAGGLRAGAPAETQGKMRSMLGGSA